MSEEQQHINPGKSRWLRATGYAVIALLLLLGGLRLSLKTDWVRGRVLDLISSRADSMLDAQLKIDRLEGDLWKEARLYGISISQRSDTLLHLDSLKVGYRVMSILGAEFEISKVELHGPRIRLQQDSASGWNWERVMVADTAAAASTDTALPDFNVAQLTITSGDIKLRQNPAVVDSVVRVSNLELSSGLGYGNGAWRARLSNLSFDFRPGRLDDPVSFTGAGAMEQGSYSLEKLVLQTGNSLLTADGSYNDQSALTARLDGKPIAASDLNPWIEDTLLHRNLRFELRAGGQLDDFETTLTARADGLEALRITLQSGYSERRGWMLKKLEVDGNGLNVEALTGGVYPISVDSLEARLDGPVALNNWQSARALGAMHVTGIRHEMRRLESFDAQLAFESGQVQLNAVGRGAAQSLRAEVQLADLAATPVQWEADLAFDHIDASAWGDSLASTDLMGSVQLEASGLRPGEVPWRYRGSLSESSWEGQGFQKLSLEGTVTDQLITNRGDLTIGESDLNWTARVNSYNSIPAYEYELRTSNLDLAEIQGLEAFPSDLRLEMRGEGRGMNLKNMRLQSSVHVDSSIVNTERIERFTCTVEISDTTAYLRDGVLESDIASGTFSLKRHLVRYYDPDNRLDMELQLRDLSSLAPLVGADTLQSRGVVKGSIHPDVTGTLELDASVLLNEVQYGEQLKIDEVEGRVHAFIMEEPEYLVSLDLNNPTLASVVLQDLTLTSSGRINRERLAGDLEFNLTSSNDTRFSQQGNFYVDRDSLHLQTTQMSLASSLRTISLQEPFGLRYVRETLRMDTLRMTTDGAYLEASVGRMDSTYINAYVRGQGLDAGIIQGTFLNDTFFDGLLSGRLEVNRDGKQIEARGDMKLKAFESSGVKLDTLLFDMRLERDSLTAHLVTYKNRNRLAEMRASLPFEVGPPSQPGETFYERPVDGYFRLYPTELSEFDDVLNQMGFENTRGLARMETRLHGRAGHPRLDGRFALTGARLSGVPIDSLVMGMEYSHDESQVALDASVYSLKQIAASVTSRLPLRIDMSQMTVELPDQQDSIRVELNTRSFDLAALNDFVDRTQVSRLRGKIDGNVALKGEFQDPEVTGNMELRDGAMRIVPANINMNDMAVNLAFVRDQIEVTNLKASSSGSFRGSGTIQLEGLEPAEMDLNFRALNFRVINTDNYQAFIDLNSRVQGTMNRPRIAGNLTFKRGFVYLTNFGEKSVEQVELDSLEQEPLEVSLYDSLSLDVDVSFNRNFYVRNKQYLNMELELDGTIDLLKAPEEDLQAFGSLRTLRGYAEPLGKRFKLDEGNLQFVGDPTNPDLFIKTAYKPPQPKQDITIWYIIEGNVEKPEFRYESDPYLEMENILSYTLFGQPFYALDSWKQVVASPNGGGGPGNLAVEVLLDRVESLATQKLGIDVVQIDSTPSGANSGTTIKTGWYLNDRVFFAMLNELSGNAPKMMFIIQYLIHNNLEVILTQGDDIHSGIDFRWQFDY